MLPPRCSEATRVPGVNHQQGRAVQPVLPIEERGTCIRSIELGHADGGSPQGTHLKQRRACGNSWEIRSGGKEVSDRAMLDKAL